MDHPMNSQNKDCLNTALIQYFEWKKGIKNAHKNAIPFIREKTNFCKLRRRKKANCEDSALKEKLLLIGLD